VVLHFVQTSTHNRNLSQSGRLTVSNIVDAAKDCSRFLTAVFSYHPQVCHIGTAYGLSFIKHSICIFIARFFGSRVLLHPHCSLSDLYVERSVWWRWYFRQVIHLTDGIIALSNEWKQVTRIVPGSQVNLLHNAVNLTPYQLIARDRFENRMFKGDVKILYLGYLGKAKGSFDLIEAAQRIDCERIKVSIELVGDELSSGELDHLRQGIAKANLTQTIMLHPPVMDEEKLACFRNADIFVFPSHTEGLPMAVIEAMASGLPIVATNVGGLPDLVHDGVNGLLVDPGQPEQLAIALLKVIDDKESRLSMGVKSVQFACEQYDIEQHVIKLVNIYEKVLSNSSLS
jgi:glycosyltransferase involved in cell wall biosynthesis